MTIEKPHDLLDLLNERVEAMEDLNVEELYSCVRSFVFAAWYLDMLDHSRQSAKYDLNLRKDELYKMQFNGMKQTCQEFLDEIDRLTLRDEEP